MDTVSRVDREGQSKKTLSGFFASKGRFPGGGNTGRDGPDQRPKKNPEKCGSSGGVSSGPTARAKVPIDLNQKRRLEWKPPTWIQRATFPELLPHKLPARTFQRRCNYQKMHQSTNQGTNNGTYSSECFSSSSPVPQRKRLDAGPRLFSHYALGLIFFCLAFGLPHPPSKTRPSPGRPVVPIHSFLHRPTRKKHQGIEHLP